MTAISIATEDPRTPDIVDLLESHLALMRRISPPGHVHALDLDALVGPSITFLAARQGEALLGVGAMKSLDPRRAEIKSMHTAPAARGHGVARRLVQHVIELATARGVGWLGLETGRQPEFEPARALYRSFGFDECEPFDSYTPNPYSTCMALDVSGHDVVGTGS